jgi:hypothetical protein
MVFWFLRNKISKCCARKKSLPTTEENLTVTLAEKSNDGFQHVAFPGWPYLNHVLCEKFYLHLLTSAKT